MKIHFIGSRGASISQLMKITRNLGVEVSGHDALDSCQPLSVNADAIVYSSAVKPDNPILVRAQELSIPTLDRSVFLGKLAKIFNNVYAVAGCHGKTTTTAMLWQTLSHVNPTVHLGGEYSAIDATNYGINREIFITEACEYKKSFLTLHPTVAVINNIDLDHTDCYGSIDETVSAFKQFCNNCKTVIVNGDDEKCANLSHNALTFGLGENCNFRALSVTKNELNQYSYSLFVFGQFIGEISLSVSGIHNLYNSLGAVALALLHGVNFSLIQKNISLFNGVKRRCELIYDKSIQIYTDYAHHPNEIVATIDALKNQHGKTIVVFQPHTYSRLKDLFDGFISAFEKADTLVLCPVYASRESVATISSIDLLNKINVPADKHYFADFEQVFYFLDKTVKRDDTILFLGAGNIDYFARKYAQSQNE